MTQKIDFEKIKQSSKVKNLKIKNHRKSYGLEFIDIKKEIQEELKTIEQRYKNNQLLQSKPNNNDEETQDFIADLDIPTQEFKQQQNNTAKRLKVKSQKKIQVAKNDTLPLNQGIDQFISERIQPIDKVIVVKKNKIRKFMKQKKKLIIIQKIKEQKEEIVKAMKMQENISKLNDFCKKKMEKQLIKKRNATIQYNDDKNQQDISKISGRRIIFDNALLKKTINPQIEDRLNDTLNNDNDSSRLSTEFYEEYYRLINSIKKEQQIRSKNSNLSKMDISSQNITQKSIRNLLSSPGNQSHSPITQLSQTQQHIFSPKQLTKKEKSVNKKSKSKSNLKHHEGLQLINQKPNNNLKSHQILQINANKVKNLQQSTDTQQFIKMKERAESAPLLMNQTNQSNKKKSQNRKKSPTQKLLQNINKQQQQKFQKKQDFMMKLALLSDEERFQYVLEQVLKIQNLYRLHLYQKGFYETQSQQIISQNNNDIQQQSAQDTVVHNYNSQSLQGLKSDQSHSNQIININEQQQQQNLVDPDLQDKIEYDQEDEFEDEEYDDEQLRSNNNLIIINQQSNDDKKVVYMSNINSCSLPQTPKIDDNQKLNKKQMNQFQKVFEYNPDNYLDPKSLNSQPYSITDNGVHQQISIKPSIKSHDSEKPSIMIQGEKIMFNDLIDSAKQSSQQQQQNEEKKIGDYEMRMFTGSESLLREFKQNTPKQPIHKDSQSNSNHNELLSNQTSVRQIISKQDSVISHLSYNNNKLQSNRQLDQDSKQSQSNDINSHSSQSLFERNSFQQFTQTKLHQIMKNNEFLNIIEMREKALDYRQTKEKKFIKKMYKNKQYSPRTYVNKKEQLEKWVQVEQEEIHKTRKQFEEEWQKTLRMIEDTQKDVDTMRQKMKIQIDNNSKHNLQFNSQSSRNSCSNYNTVSKQEPRKSILEQEEYQPLSQRSIRLSMSSSKINNQQHDKYSIIKDLVKSDISMTTSKKHSPRQEQIEQKQDNLIDFLEQSWIKNQHKQFQDQENDLNNRQSYASKQGIFIEDQKNDPNSSQLSDNIKQQIIDYIQDSDEVSQNLITERRVDATISNIVQQFHNQTGHDDERPLTRSRSQQDLSDLLKKSKINFNDIDINLEEVKHANLDSYRYDPRLGNEQDQIKIQENMFDDSSNRYSKGKNYYNDQNDLQSNDSLLNDSVVNNYIQDQKFSIDDFKSLDKRKILAQNLNDDEDESILGRVESQLNIHHDNSIHLQEEQMHDNIHSQLFQANESQIKAQNEFIDAEPSFTDPRRQSLQYDNNNDVKMSHTPEVPTAFMQHQQAFLFQNTKPGENIKISDILRKTQSMIDPNSSNSFQLGGDSSQLLFQNTQINQSMINPQLQPLLTQDFSQLADQITEELLQNLLSTTTVVQRRQVQVNEDQILVQSSLIIPEPAADVFIMDTHINEKENRRETVEFRMRIVMEQDLIRVENYINEVIQSLQQAELEYLTMLAHNTSTTPTQESNYHRQFLNVLTTPIRRIELDLLNQLQTSEIGSYEHFETAMDLNTNPILPIDLYLDIERLREESQIRMLYQNGMQEVDLESSVLQESTHIHNKSIFDALNESLMKFRPYGIQGEPMPWSNKNRRLQTKVDTNSVDTERLFFMVKQDVMRWAQTFAGCSPSPIFLFKRQIEESEQFDDELFQETRERRLASMLATEVVENEHQWLNYEFEEAQVKIDLSDMILEHLVEEVAVFLNKQHGMEVSE